MTLYAIVPPLNYPLVNQHSCRKWSIYSWFTHEKWWCYRVLLVCQRVPSTKHVYLMRKALTQHILNPLSSASTAELTRGFHIGFWQCFLNSSAWSKAKSCVPHQLSSPLQPVLVKHGARFRKRSMTVRPLHSWLCQGGGLLCETTSTCDPHRSRPFFGASYGIPHNGAGGLSFQGILI